MTEVLDPIGFLGQLHPLSEDVVERLPACWGGPGGVILGKRNVVYTTVTGRWMQGGGFSEKGAIKTAGVVNQERKLRPGLRGDGMSGGEGENILLYIQ